MKKPYAGIGMALLLAACTPSSFGDPPVSEMEIQGGRGPIRSVQSSTYQFPLDRVPEDMTRWAPAVGEMPVITTSTEFDRSGWATRQHFFSFEDMEKPFQILRECETHWRYWRKCSMTIPPSGFEFSEVTIYIDGPDGFHHVHRMNDERNTEYEQRVWLDRATRILHSESSERHSGRTEHVGSMERHRDINGYEILKIERLRDKPETRVTYERLATDRFGNVTLNVERQDPRFPDPARPGTVRLHVVEFSYYEPDTEGGP